MKSIQIVSSYSDSCGNAYFTKVLESNLRSLGLSATCAELNLELTQSIEPEIRKKADNHIRELCRNLRNADGVNIQLEAGLFGTYPSDIFNRVKQLISANRNTSVTLHSPRISGSSALQRAAIKSMLRGRLRQGIGQWLSHKEGSIHISLNRRLIQLITNVGAPIIVHTQRAKDQIKNIFGYENVSVHPLKFVPPEYQADSSKLTRLRHRLNLADDEKIIGMFGYINEYKGHTLALDAIEHLPENFKLFIFGRVHPQTIKQGEPVNPYLDKLQHLIRNKKLQDRVLFIGEQSTEDFIDYAASVDCVWLPYIEVGQDGSGIASICCDVSPRVLASTSFAFDELLKLIPYESIERFDIGNSIELATKTLHSPGSRSPGEIANQKFSTESQAMLYANCVGFSLN